MIATIGILDVRQFHTLLSSEFSSAEALVVKMFPSRCETFFIKLAANGQRPAILLRSL